MGAAACKKPFSSRPLHALQEPVSGLRIHWSLNYNGFYLIKRGIAHTAEECLRKSTRGVLSLLLLSRENKVHVAHKWEVTSNFVHKQQGREQHAFLKSQVRDRSLVTAVQKADCKSEICSNARAAFFFPPSPY